MGELKVLFGQRLKNLRLAKGLTQEELAERAGLHPTFIGIIERGKQSASLDSVEKLARALEIEVRQFFSPFPRGKVGEEKERLILKLGNILRERSAEKVKKAVEICRILLEEEKPYPAVAEKKRKYRRRK